MKPANLLVAEKRCDQCLFSEARIVDQARADDVVAECQRKGAAFICHRFSLVGEREGCCRAFFDRDLSLVVVLAKELGLFEFVPLPPKHGAVRSGGADK